MRGAGWLCGIGVAGCGGPPPVPARVVFLDGALRVEGPAAASLPGGRSVPGGVLVERAWAPGEQVEVAGVVHTAPPAPQCEALFAVALGDARATVAAGNFPEAALAFSPDGARLAVGTEEGALRVLDAWTGAVLAERVLPEAAVKQVAWSVDGGLLFVSEQSPDATLHALDPSSLAPRWSRRLADDVESSAPPAAGDVYGAWTLPAGYGLGALPDGGVLVAAAHAWAGADGATQNRSVLLRLGADGGVQARWPASGAADTVLRALAVDPGGRAAVTVNRSAAGTPAPGTPPDGVLVFDVASLQPGASVVPAPLPPWFPAPFVWEALDVSGERLGLGLGDGRVQLYGADGGLLATHAPGAPLLAGEVPIHASVGWGRFVGGDFVVAISGTLIPWGAASPDLRPPSPHPEARTVRAFGPDGAPGWSFTTDAEPQGLSVAPGGGWLAVGLGVASGAAAALDGGYGALRLRPGAAPQPVRCPTRGPVFFRHALAQDGRLAVVEGPVLGAGQIVEGAWRVVVLR